VCHAWAVRQSVARVVPINRSRNLHDRSTIRARPTTLSFHPRPSCRVAGHRDRRISLDAPSSRRRLLGCGSFDNGRTRQGFLGNARTLVMISTNGIPFRGSGSGSGHPLRPRASGNIRSVSSTSAQCVITASGGNLVYLARIYSCNPRPRLGFIRNVTRLQSAPCHRDFESQIIPLVPRFRWIPEHL